MLQGRLTLLAVGAAITLTACSSGGAIEENVVRPGITAIEEGAPNAACEANAATVRSAIESYTLLEGDPPPDEQALVDAGYLREASTDWDVVDGELVAENPDCAPAAVATMDIVTEDEPLTGDELFATFDQNQIDSVGGEACARELASIVAAAETYLADRDTEPADIDELVATGYLPATPSLWALVDDQLVPTDGSGCTDLG